LTSVHSFANGSDLARAVGKRHDAELCWTATAAFEDHQIAVIERARAHSRQDLVRPGPGIFARSQHDPFTCHANAALRQYGDQMFQRRFAPLVAAP
jgi:hypothetical protein